MARKKRGVLEARIFFEQDEDGYERMRRWLIGKIASAPATSETGVVAVGVYDPETGEMIGFAMHGTPNSETQKVIEAAFNKKEVA